MPFSGDTTGMSVFLFSDRIDRDDLPAASPIRALDRYWSSLARDGDPPSRAQLDPLEMPRELLPWVFLMDVVRTGDGFDYRFRLAGTSNVRLVGRDPTGRLASEIFGTRDRRFMMETFDVTVRGRAATFWRAAVPQDTYGQVRVYRGLFPLFDDGGEVNMLLGAAVPDYD